MNQLNITKKFLEDYHSEEGFKKLLQIAKNIGQKFGIDDKFDNFQRPRRKTAKFAYELKMIIL